MRPKTPLQRTDLLDTSLSAHRRQIEMLRKMSPEEKLRLTFAMMESSRELKRIANDYDRSNNRCDL